MDGVDSDLLELVVYLLGRHHRSVGRGLLSIRGHLHPSGDSAESFLSRDVGHVDEGIVPSGEDVRDALDGDLVADDLWSERLGCDCGLFLYFLFHVLSFINS